MSLLSSTSTFPLRYFAQLLTHVSCVFVHFIPNIIMTNDERVGVAILIYVEIWPKYTNQAFHGPRIPFSAYVYYFCT